MCFALLLSQFGRRGRRDSQGRKQHCLPIPSLGHTSPYPQAECCWFLGAQLWVPWGSWDRVAGEAPCKASLPFLSLSNQLHVALSPIYLSFPILGLSSKCHPVTGVNPGMQQLVLLGLKQDYFPALGPGHIQQGWV